MVNDLQAPNSQCMQRHWRTVTTLFAGLQILGGDLAGVVEEADASSRFNAGDKARKQHNRGGRRGHCCTWQCCRIGMLVLLCV